MVWIVFGIIISILAGVTFGVLLKDDYIEGDIFAYIILCATFILFICFGTGIESIEEDAKLEGVREYIENPQKYKVTRIPSRLEINYNDSIK